MIKKYPKLSWALAGACTIMCSNTANAGLVDLSFKQTNINEEALLIKLRGADGFKQQMISGQWELPPMRYTVEVYFIDTAKGDGDDGLPQADSEYQIITDTIVITEEQSKPVVRSYDIPAYRGRYEGSNAFALSVGGMVVPDEFEVPGLKYNMAGGDKLANNPFTETDTFSQSPFSEASFTNAELYLHRQFAGSMFLFEAAGGIATSDTALQYTHASAGLGLGGSVGGMRVWIAGGGEMLNGSINNATVDKASEQVEVDGTYNTAGGYLRLGVTPKNGGLIGTLKYNTEGVISFNLGWNFGGTTTNYKLSNETVSHRQ